jgi:hypothetical protein
MTVLSSDNLINWLAIGFVLLYMLYKIAQRRRAVTEQDGPILSSSNMLLEGGLQSLNKGVVAGFSYNIMTNDKGRVMFFVELGHDTQAHIVAYGDKSNIGQQTESFISKKWLEPAELEGDFPDYFHMYCSPSKQMELREVFTPDIMAQFVDFCRSYDLEIFKDSLYVSRAEDAVDTADQTTLVTDITNFLQQNSQVFNRL